ncbi:MAG: EAL domain-containing protein [Pseudomonadota bacterium]
MSTVAPMSPPAGAARRGGEGALPWRVRVSVYLAFAALAALWLWQGQRALVLDSARTRDLAVVEAASLLQAQALQLGRHALLARADPATGAVVRQQLEQTLVEAAASAVRLDGLAREAIDQSGRGDLRAARDAWEASRERLWYRAHALVRALQRNGDASGDIAALAQSVQAESRQAGMAAAALQQGLHEDAERRVDEAARQLQLQGVAVLALLLVLAVAIVEPTARLVRRQIDLLGVQSLELEQLAHVASRTSALVLLTDAQDRIEWANESFTRLTGWSLGEARGAMTWDLLQHPHADPQARSRLEAARADGRAARVELLCRRRDGRSLWLDIDVQPRLDRHGVTVGFVSVGTDVTQRMAEQRKLQVLWEALPVGVVVQDEAGTVVDANRVAEQLLGVDRDGMLERDGRGPPSWHALREDGSDLPADQHPAMQTLADGQPRRGEAIGVRLAEGGLRWLLVNTEPLRDVNGNRNGVVTCLGDVTEHRRLQDRLHASARTDGLTGLPNRAVALERVRHAIAHAGRHPGYGFAVLFIDFDRFKHVNDSLGHAAGDELLRQVALRLRHALRPGDGLARLLATQDLAARMGGDEFVVVLDGVRDADVLAAVTGRLLGELSEPYTVLDHPVRGGASIGAVLCCDGAADAEDLLRCADTAMYHAKRSGRGRWVLFEPAMHDRLAQTLAVEQDLRRALRNDELFVVYQPLVDLASQRMQGVEALVRWQHPERGLLAPAAFIGVAEECGLIDDVGRRVLDLACAQFADWRRSLGPDAPALLSVNLSRAQLDRPGLVDDVTRALDSAAMPPSALLLEVTESLAAQDERVQSTLREFKARGLRLALDDFGTGYSSLACLHQLPVDTVKIDRSFVVHAETVEYHRVLIEATIRVARTLGMVTVAEGIETDGQAALMRSLDCDLGQGWLYGRPLTGPEIDRWIRERLAAASAPA